MLQRTVPIDTVRTPSTSTGRNGDRPEIAPRRLRRPAMDTG